MAEKDEKVGVGLSSTGQFDQDIYGSSRDRFSGYSATVTEEGDEGDQEQRADDHHSRAKKTQPNDGLIDDNYDPFAEAREANGSGLVNTRIVDRENAYRKRRFERMLSPERGDAFGDKTPARSYKEIVQTQQLEQERAEVVRKIQQKREEQEQQQTQSQEPQEMDATPKRRRKRMRWDQEAPEKTDGESQSEWDTASESSSSSLAATPSRTASRWDATPVSGSAVGATPGRKNRWG
ncbi:splicing factor 3B subunit, putative [Phytophthora infestans T30-4]|uniref:Splicing factor 3B subunit, putative n=1 Tax=Phytophthora infestans (strain T30-4) TaxID=403677 RepID=D0N926_PHYIT|nr:splicing factor 3B subunit, putative [Phytophthora infestans T30-4]EEY54061.1 splicing factor 3B subunit, putative [Phytophthora infestans T30-4]|eukprot:XP_002904692.1 splicing factor 3B subunit, putative [Phytophthora infestans T30-4]